ncbi:EAL domain-containing protein [Rhodocyclus tenuis]|uniref:EAL domain-containing protein n=1 Tax=Rhodocyclus tenuis TaxID=1066 RepID=UPI001903C89C|nr:EAL domain-containing protein [Rhodocyclus tenuis]MBK1679010.1 hypothetical protein [Rhodocyclus tenuis]
MSPADLLEHFNSLYRAARTGISTSPIANAASAETRFARADAQIVAHVADLRLNSVFQPIFDAGNGRLISHEALLRPWRRRGMAGDEGRRRGGEEAVSPEEVFARSGERGDIVHLDRLCRTLHTINFSWQQQLRGEQQGDLFLNIHPRHLLEVSGDHGSYFESVLRRCGLTPERVVLEILESSVDDLPALQKALANYQRRGYRIAIDDFGRSHSNFDRLWQLQPDIVKLDRSLIVTASDNDRVRRTLPRLVDIIHELDALTVFEGIETQEQLTLARDSGADALQGYLLGRPAAECRSGDSIPLPLRVDSAQPAQTAPLPCARLAAESLANAG